MSLSRAANSLMNSWSWVRSTRAWWRTLSGQIQLSGQLDLWFKATSRAPWASHVAAVDRHQRVRASQQSSVGLLVRTIRASSGSRRASEIRATATSVIPSKRGTASNFRPMSIVTKRLDASGYHSGTEVGLGACDIVLHEA